MQGIQKPSDIEFDYIHIRANSIGVALVLEQECGYTQLLADVGVHTTRHNCSAIGRASNSGVTRELKEG